MVPFWNTLLSVERTGGTLFKMYRIPNKISVLHLLEKAYCCRVGVFVLIPTQGLQKAGRF